MPKIDDSLIEKLKKRDEGAYKQLYNNYKRWVFCVAYFYLKRMRDCDDAVQETFMRVYINIDTYDKSKGAFTTWMNRILFCYCMDEIKSVRNKMHRNAMSNPLEEITVELMGDPENVTNVELIKDWIKNLPPIYSKVFSLKFTHGFKEKEIASILSIPLSTVKNRLFDGKKLIKEKLKFI